MHSYNSRLHHFRLIILFNSIEKTGFSSGVHFLVVVASLFVIIGGINLAHAVLTPLLISGFLSVLGAPIVSWMRRRRVPLSIAVLLVITLIILVIALIAFIVVASANNFLSSLPEYQNKLNEQMMVLTSALASRGIIMSNDVLQHALSGDPFRGFATDLIGGFGSMLSLLVLVLLTVSFVLLETTSFRDKIRAAVGDSRAAFPTFTKLVTEMRRYMIYQTIIGLLTGSVVAIWLSILGVDYALFLGLLSFLLCYVPNVGSAISLVPTIAVSFIQFGIGRTFVVGLGYLVLTFVLGSVIQPRLMGHRLGLSTLVVFLSLLVWGSVLGVIGMVLCVPLTMVLKFGLESSDNTRWIASLLASDVVKPVNPRIDPVHIDVDPIT